MGSVEKGGEGENVERKPEAGMDRLVGETLLEVVFGKDYSDPFLSGSPRSTNVYVRPYLNARDFDESWAGQPNTDN